MSKRGLLTLPCLSIYHMACDNYKGVIWGDISRSVNGENVLGGAAYKNK